MAILPYGSWPTRIRPELVASAGMRLNYPTILPDGSFAWLEGRPEEQGRQIVVRRSPDGRVRDVSPEGRNARTQVHEGGGLPFVFAGDELVFVELGRHQLRVVSVAQGGGGERALGEGGSYRVAEPIVDAGRGRLIAVGELHGNARYPENGLVAIDRASGRIDWLVRGHDFFASPALSPDSKTLAYLAWDHPHMPWDAAGVYVVTLGEDGAPGAPEHVAGDANGSAFQPLWSPSGELYFALESAATPWNLHRLRAGRVECVRRSDDEWGAPLWNLGTRLFAFASDREIVGAVMSHGVSRLVRVDVENGSEETLSTEFLHVGMLDARGSDVLFTVGWAGSGTGVVHLDARTKQATVLKEAAGHLFTGPSAILTRHDVPEPEAVHFETSEGAVAHGFFYAPRSAEHAGPAGEKPPLMVLAHGGPTGAANATLQLSVLTWTTRGFAVLDVAYRGSVGFGKPYRDALRGRWGIVDVDDCVAGALAMAREGRVDRARLAIRGGSAGGFTVLMALVRYPDVFAAATCLYGVSDPRSLTSDTHKFESHYDSFLFGSGEARERAFDERSPLRRAGEIRAPVLFFQGMEDKVVLPSQTLAIHAALEARGVPTEFHGYAGEQHGFRKAETLLDVFEKERAFYERVLGAR